jgi:hypothetical protein
MISSNYFNECNSIFPCALETSEMSPMELGPNDWNSIYIPIIPNNICLTNVRGETHRFQPKHVSYFLEKLLKVGKVRRVDYIDRNVDNHSTPVKGAFVHFDYWYNNQHAHNLRQTLNTTGTGRIGGYAYTSMDNHAYYGFMLNRKAGYIDIRINHKPISSSECDRNTQQLLSDTNRLEAEVVAKNNRIAELEKELDNVKKMLFALSQDTPAETPVNEADMTIYPGDDDKHPLTLADLS